MSDAVVTHTTEGTMMWTYDGRGGFIVGSDHDNWSYAYPTSPHAVLAKRKPNTVAEAMATQSDLAAEWLPTEIIEKHNAYLRAQFDAIIDQIHG